MSSKLRRTLIQLAGILIVLLAFGSALLPLAHHVPARMIIGLLLVAGGILELAAFAARPVHHVAGGVAAAATFLAGLRLTLDPSANYFTVLNFVILWLIVRSAALFFLGLRTNRPLCSWALFAAAVDLILAIALLSGLQIAFLVVGIFGPTSEILATFAWVFAASFVAAGIFLIGSAPATKRGS
jgi:uncharacterized membrane protein HdeD (DUF308 family)